ncbi:TetR/AcrR family transcriptional regulator [Alcanivorax profundi]|uniref:TetR/AcrR family transcriptional regulator n=1 Tax=Alcanivorax profundi TaxID=2338368 RepID=A0A418XTU8_9GAMM|nr:TetR/AcrR family transcriptional regulator [Alcanivorax profundi]RJG16131.1 TetR/AcrR family transcriptional regulator [Alcanivorax profundi]
MDTPRTERGLKRRQALLDAATDIFSTEGYTGTTLDMIIARAGGSRRSLYQYFGDKDGLFSAVMQHHVGTMMAELEATGVEHLPASEGLHRLSSTFVKLMLSPLYLELYRQLIGLAPAFPTLAEQIYEAGPTLVLEKLHDYLQWLVDRGELPSHRLTRHTARQFLGMVKTDFQICALLAPHKLPDAEAIDAHVRNCITVLLDNR